MFHLLNTVCRSAHPQTVRYGVIALPLAWVLPGLVWTQIQLSQPAAPFTLTDQFEHPTTIHFPQNTGVLLLFTDRSGRPATRQWQQAFLSLPVTPRLITIAGTGWVPALFKSTVRNAFSQSKPVPIDWNDAVARQYGYDGGCRLIVISASGQVLAVENGNFSPARFGALSRLLQ